MTKEFIPYEPVLELKELAFDEPCLAGYSKSTEKLEFYSRPFVTKDSFTVDAPTFSQAFRWFREKCGLISYVHPLALLQDTKKWCYEITNFESSWDEDSDLHTLEEAELACLIKLIQIVKTKNI